MILSGNKLFLVTLIRYRKNYKTEDVFNSILQVHVDARNEVEAGIYATRIVGEGWISECAELIDTPCWLYTEYKGYKYWEEPEDNSEHMRCFYHVLPPQSSICFCPAKVSNRKELSEFIDSLIEGDLCTH